MDKELISIDKKASDELKNLLKSMNVETDTLRIFMVGMGCGGAMFNLAQDKKNDDDYSMEFDGMTYVVQENLAEAFEGFDIITFDQYGTQGLAVRPRKTQESGCASCGGGCH